MWDVIRVFFNLNPVKTLEDNFTSIESYPPLQYVFIMFEIIDVKICCIFVNRRSKYIDYS